VRDSDAGIETPVLELLSKRPLYTDHRAEDREEATTVSSLLSYIQYCMYRNMCGVAIEKILTIPIRLIWEKFRFLYMFYKRAFFIYRKIVIAGI
jgi:hypothetical protein